MRSHPGCSFVLPLILFAASCSPQQAATPAPSTQAPASAASASVSPPVDAKKEAAAKQLLADRAKWQASYKAELARWTPELHSEGKSLAEKTYASGKDAILAMMKGQHRTPGAAERDKYRHPLETLEFFGLKPTMTVLDIGPGEGWYTELLAPALAKRGAYVATSGDPDGPPDERPTFYAQRFKDFLDKAPEVYGKVQIITIDSKAPALGRENAFDLVLVMRGLHGMQTGGTLDKWLEDIHRALRVGGILGIEEHRAATGADPSESAKKGYLPEAWVIDHIEAAGFKLEGKSEVNANPKDTKDYPEGVWALPPTLRLGDVDRDKYLAIGESDRMTLKFAKVAAKRSGSSTAGAH